MERAILIQKNKASLAGVLRPTRKGTTKGGTAEKSARQLAEESALGLSQYSLLP